MYPQLTLDVNCTQGLFKSCGSLGRVNAQREKARHNHWPSPQSHKHLANKSLVRVGGLCTHEWDRWRVPIKNTKPVNVHIFRA